MRRTATPPIPLEPLDLLAGLADGVELEADDLPAGVAEASERTPTAVTVDDVGRLLRSDDPTVRQLIRTPVLRPREPRARRVVRAVPRRPGKPGE